MNSVVKNGLFQIPLYHGTSTLFVDSINKFGLGGVNLIQQLRGNEFLKTLQIVADRAFRNDVEWQTSRFAVQWIADQISFGDSGNFQHGETYLTPSRNSAISYALTNRFGSELITQAYRVYGFIKERGPELLEEQQLNQHPVTSLFESDAQPILIVAKNVPVVNVISEGGEPPDRTIKQLQDWCNHFDLKDCVINLNFRLREPLSPALFHLEFIHEEQEKNFFNW